jgi:hypothetical protein
MLDESTSLVYEDMDVQESLGPSGSLVVWDLADLVPRLHGCCIIFFLAIGCESKKIMKQKITENIILWGQYVMIPMQSWWTHTVSGYSDQICTIHSSRNEKGVHETVKIQAVINSCIFYA